MQEPAPTLGEGDRAFEGVDHATTVTSSVASRASSRLGRRAARRGNLACQHLRILLTIGSGRCTDSDNSRAL